MFSMFVNLIFTIISKIGDLILSPLVSAVSLLIPSFSDFVNNIFTFLQYGLTYIMFVFKLFMIPQACLQIVVTVALATFSITTLFRTYKLILQVYQKFKP